MAQPNQTGKQTEVAVRGQTIAYTTSSYTITYDTASSDMNDSPTPYTAVTSRYGEGTLEWDGSQIEAHEAFMNANGSQIDDISLRISDGEKTYHFQDVTMTSLEGENPADGKSNETIEWRADNFRRE